MLRFAGRATMAALRPRFAAPAFESRAAMPSVNPPPFRSALALTPAVPANLLRWLSLGGRAHPGVGADAVVPIAAGLDTGGCRGGGSRGLAGGKRKRHAAPPRWARQQPGQPLVAPVAPIATVNDPDDRHEGEEHGSAHSGALRPGKLTSLIKQCGDVGTLQGLVEEQREMFNHIHVSAAWVALRRMENVGGRGEEEALLQQLQDLTGPTVQEMGERQVANVIHSMATLHESGRMIVDDALAGKLLDRAKATAGDFEPQGVANLLWALSTMGVKPEPGLLEAMQGRAIATARGFTAEGVANLVQALSNMGVTPEPGLLEAMQGRAIATVGSFNPQNVVNLVWALSTMGFKPDRALMESMQGRAIKTAGDFKPQNIANLVWALSTMGVKPGADLLEAMQQRAIATVGDFNRLDVLMLRSAFTKMGVEPDARLVAAMRGRATATAGDFDSRAASNSTKG